jgi:hypothetical protein
MWFSAYYSNLSYQYAGYISFCSKTHDTAPDKLIQWGMLQRTHILQQNCVIKWDRYVCKAPYTLSVKLSDFTVWCHTWWKNWVNCAVLTGNSPGLRTVLYSRLSHRELHSSLRESHSFLSFPADIMMASSQGTQPSKINNRESTLTFIEAYRSLPELWDTENRRYSNTVKKAAAYDTRTRRHTELTKKTDRPDGKPVLCQRTFSSVFRALFLHS